MSSRRSKDPFTLLSLFWMVLLTPCKSLYVSILVAHSCSMVDAMSIVCKWMTAAVLSSDRSYLIDIQSSKTSCRMMHWPGVPAWCILALWRRSAYPRLAPSPNKISQSVFALFSISGRLVWSRSMTWNAHFSQYTLVMVYQAARNLILWQRLFQGGCDWFKDPIFTMLVLEIFSLSSRTVTVLLIMLLVPEYWLFKVSQNSPTLMAHSLVHNILRKLKSSPRAPRSTSFDSVEALSTKSETVKFSSSASVTCIINFRRRWMAWDTCVLKILPATKPNAITTDGGICTTVIQFSRSRSG